MNLFVVLGFIVASIFIVDAKLPHLPASAITTQVKII
jgi:hypothetical protein